VGFFTSFNGEDLATFTICSIFKTFVPTYLPACLPSYVSTYYLSTCLVVLTLFAFAGHVMDGWMNECQATGIFYGGTDPAPTDGWTDKRTYLFFFVFFGFFLSDISPLLLN
jgi:hypothetical protein